MVIDTGFIHKNSVMDIQEDIDIYVTKTIARQATVTDLFGVFLHSKNSHSNIFNFGNKKYFNFMLIRNTLEVAQK